MVPTIEFWPLCTIDPKASLHKKRWQALYMMANYQVGKSDKI